MPLDPLQLPWYLQAVPVHARSDVCRGSAAAVVPSCARLICPLLDWPYCSFTSRRLSFVWLKEPSRAVATGIWRSASDHKPSKQRMPGPAATRITLDILILQRQLIVEGTMSVQLSSLGQMTAFQAANELPAGSSRFLERVLGQTAHNRQQGSGGL